MDRREKIYAILKEFQESCKFFYDKEIEPLGGCCKYLSIAMHLDKILALDEPVGVEKVDWAGYADHIDIYGGILGKTLKKSLFLEKKVRITITEIKEEEK